MNELKKVASIVAVRGQGLMIGFDLPESLAALRKDLLFKHHIFTGEAKPNTVRLLPSLALSKNDTDLFLEYTALELKQEVSV
jgi:acetylornithine/N-succinyldiaminopimelate aminotransferase